MSALSAGGPRTFRDLKELLGTTDGNLSAHARRLERARYISCRKSFVGRVPKTEYRATPAGRRALDRYLRQIERLIETARGPSSSYRARSRRPRE
jgi:DNA-binding MarR family transcriptional regulator